MVGGHGYLLLPLLLLPEIKCSSWRRRKRPGSISRGGRRSDSVSVAASITTHTAFASVFDRKDVARLSRVLGDAVVGDDDCSRSENDPRPRHMVLFRGPSRHTYGFASNFKYDLPVVELRNLVGSTTTCDDRGIHQFIPVEGNLQQASREGEVEEENQEQMQTPKSKNQSKKKVSNISHPVPSLYWIEPAEGVSSSGIARAARRAILTHATFLIHERICFSKEDWNDALDSSTGTGSCSKMLEQMEMIDMDNPNMSRDARSKLIARVSSLIEKQHPELQLRVPQFLRQPSCDMESILIHHCVTPNPTQQLVPHRQLARRSDEKCTHCLYFGCRTSGSKGGPSRTLRRTHRGLLKEYALKSRRAESPAATGSAERSNTSTAMEPEIGFLMSNLASAGRGSRILDPCCGSGSLLLYAAALGATHLVGVDADPTSWKDAKREFRGRVNAIDGAPLAVPRFFHGDVVNPGSTQALCSPSSYDAILCDPPYNIGAPVYSSSGKDLRPRNYHREQENFGGDSGSVSNQVRPDLVVNILAIARRVLVNGGRIVLFLPVRMEEIGMPLEEVLLSRGCTQWEVSGGDEQDSSGLRLLKSSRLQHFSPTFARWLVCMEKRSIV